MTRRYEVMSIPTLLLFKDGEPAAADHRRPGQGAAPPGAAGVPVTTGERPSRSRSGEKGEAVADLQRRLARLDLPTAPDPDGFFGAGTKAAVEGFQYRRGLRVDGVCGPQTWAALVEAGLRLGDRFLYLRRPMLRGDDVADAAATPVRPRLRHRARRRHLRRR